MRFSEVFSTGVVLTAIAVIATPKLTVIVLGRIDFEIRSRLGPHNKDRAILEAVRCILSFFRPVPPVWGIKA